MFGWWNEASVRDSSRKRVRPQLKVSKASADFGRTEWPSARTATSPGRYSLIATFRFRLASVAR
jgi:hypothetical protein